MDKTQNHLVGNHRGDTRPISSSPDHRANPLPGIHARTGAARILLIEDHANLRRALAALLEVHGYQVATAGDGSQALVALTRDAPDLVILDLELSGMQEMRVLGEIRERSPDVPVVLMAHDQAPVSSAIPSVTVLPKPFPTEWLLRDIRRALSTPEHHSKRQSRAPSMGSLRPLREF